MTQEQETALALDAAANDLGLIATRLKVAARHLEASAPKGEEARWHWGMRDGEPRFCWHYVVSDFDGKEAVCILERGHDDGVHEPECHCIENGWAVGYHSPACPLFNSTDNAFTPPKLRVGTPADDPPAPASPPPAPARCACPEFGYKYGEHADSCVYAVKTPAPAAAVELQRDEEERCTYCHAPRRAHRADIWDAHQFVTPPAPEPPRECQHEWGEVPEPVGHQMRTYHGAYYWFIEWCKKCGALKCDQAIAIPQSTEAEQV